MEGIIIISIYDSSYKLIYKIPGNSYGATVQDIYGDGLNEIVSASGSGVITTYDTPAKASDPLPITNTNHYSERRI